MEGFVKREVIYRNDLSSSEDVKDWIMEGDGAVSFPLGRMRQEGIRPPEEGQAANIVHWCPEVFPDRISISWDFYPIHEPGLCILFFAAMGKNGEDIHGPNIQPRTGPYKQYHSGDINALHVSYFRRKHPVERGFNTCNLRKSCGFHLVAQGADPIPSIPDVAPPYRIECIKFEEEVHFSIGSKDGKLLRLFSWHDDGKSYGPVLGGGKIGFRQMTPMIAEYANLEVARIQRGSLL